MFQNPKERVVLLEYGKNASAVDVDGKNARNQQLSAMLSPKKLPGSALFPASVHPPLVGASEVSNVGKFSSVHHLATNEVCGIAAVRV